MVQNPECLLDVDLCSNAACKVAGRRAAALGRDHLWLCRKAVSDFNDDDGLDDYEMNETLMDEVHECDVREIHVRPLGKCCGASVRCPLRIDDLGTVASEMTSTLSESRMHIGILRDVVSRLGLRSAKKFAFRSALEYWRGCARGGR